MKKLYIKIDVLLRRVRSVEKQRWTDFWWT